MSRYGTMIRMACEERAARSGAVFVSNPSFPSRKKLKKKKTRKSVDEEGFGMAGPPKIYSTDRVQRKSGDDNRVKFSKISSGREQRRIVISDPESFVAHFIPVEAFFTTKSVKENKIRGIAFASGPPSATHGVGTSPSASTLEKPEKKKKFPKIKAKPTGK